MLNVADHSYLGLISGKPRVSVTTMLAEMGYIQKRWYKEGKQDLGTNVHLLTHAHDKGLKFKAPEIYAKYLPPYKALLAQTGITIEDSEVEIEEPILGYAGTLDKLARSREGEYGIVDLKVTSGGYQAWHEYQSCLYELGLLWHPKYKGIQIKWRAGIIMTPDLEMPKLIPHNRIQGIHKICQSLAVVHADKVRRRVEMEQNIEEDW
jgi:hypothetical protein